ncbi:hypothetical protein HWV62_37791 [Athelia sp. TMB]|nr:hypothetical protein HWV62_37791 [Athelia sp. TMB]
MLVSSTINPAHSANIPVAVLSLVNPNDGGVGTERFLVKVEEDWNQMLSVAQNTLRLPHARLILRTHSLDICAGHAVTLSRASWPLLAGLIGEINVMVDEDSQADQTFSARVQEQHEASSELDVEYDGHEHGGHEHEQDEDEHANGFSSEDEGCAPEEEQESESEHDEEHAQDEEEDEPQVKQEEDVITEEPRESHQRPASQTTVQRPVKYEASNQRSGSSNLHENEIDSSQASSSQPTPSQEERLILTISYTHPEGEFMHSMFKIRSTATVKSALKGACRTFGLDVARASLMLVVAGDNEVELLSDCAEGETLGQVGAVGGSSFVIFMEDE